MTPAPEFGVFLSVVPLDYHAVVVALPVCVPLEPTRVHFVGPTSRRLSLLVRYLLHYPHYHFSLPLGREAVLPPKTLHPLLISLHLHI